MFKQKHFSTASTGHSRGIRWCPPPLARFGEGTYETPTLYTVLGEWVNPHRERQTIPQGQTSSPPKSSLTPTAKARPNQAAIATAAETPGTTHRARPRSPFSQQHTHLPVLIHMHYSRASTKQRNPMVPARLYDSEKPSMRHLHSAYSNMHVPHRLRLPMMVCVECLPADKPWDVVSVTRRSYGVAPRACVRVYARVLSAAESLRTYIQHTGLPVLKHMHYSTASTRQRNPMVPARS